MDEKKNELKQILAGLQFSYNQRGLEECTKWLDPAFDVDMEWNDALEERELKEVLFSCMYAEEYAHGTAGHNRLMLIAKLADILDVYEEVIDTLIAYVESGDIG